MSAPSQLNAGWCHGTTDHYSAPDYTFPFTIYTGDLRV